jgi:hypothetical protein
MDPVSATRATHPSCLHVPMPCAHPRRLRGGCAANAARLGVPHLTRGRRSRPSPLQESLAAWPDLSDVPGAVPHVGGRRNEHRPTTIKSMLLADDYFCIVTDDRSGRLRLSDRTAGLSLAAALLRKHMVCFRRIGSNERELRALRGSPPPDALAHHVLAQSEAEPQHRDVRTWSSFLAATAVDDVAQRVDRARTWRRVETRGWGRTGVEYQPQNANVVAWHLARLARLLSGGHPFDHRGAVLTGLAIFTRPAGHVFRDHCSVRSSDVIHQMPGGLLHLIAHVQAAVGDVALHGRGGRRR